MRTLGDRNILLSTRNIYGLHIYSTFVYKMSKKNLPPETYLWQPWSFLGCSRRIEDCVVVACGRAAGPMWQIICRSHESDKSDKQLAGFRIPHRQELNLPTPPRGQLYCIVHRQYQKGHVSCPDDMH